MSGNGNGNGENELHDNWDGLGGLDDVRPDPGTPPPAWPGADAAGLTRLQNRTARAGMAIVGERLAEVVQYALSPALDADRAPADRYVPACGCAVRELAATTPLGAVVDGEVSVERRMMICPMHPEDGLLCDDPACVGRHAAERHADDDPTAYCFVCSEPIPGDRLTPVFAAVELRRSVPLPYMGFDGTGVPVRLSYKGEIHTYPVTFLCVEHAGLLERTIQLPWPAGVDHPLPPPPPVPF